MWSKESPCVSCVQWGWCRWSPSDMWLVVHYTAGLKWCYIRRTSPGQSPRSWSTVQLPELWCWPSAAHTTVVHHTPARHGTAHNSHNIASKLVIHKVYSLSKQNSYSSVLGTGNCTFPKQIQPSTLCRMVKWVSAFGLSNKSSPK